MSFGTAKAGSLKADQWRTLYTIFIPLAMISLWVDDIPGAAPNANTMSAVLENLMALVTFVSVACKHSTSAERRTVYLQHIRSYVQGLQTLYPGFLLPSHHLAFHIYDFLELFGPMRSWWCFPFERLIGMLQRIPSNHKECT